LMAPKLGSAIFTKSIIFWASCSPLLLRLSMHRATPSQPPRYFIKKALPSITPRPPGGVQSPSPSTRVESETTATVLPRLVSSNEASLLSLMLVEIFDTPGVYQMLNQLKP